MSTRVALSIAVLGVAAVVLGLGHYHGREQPAPAAPPPVPEVKPAPVSDEPAHPTVVIERAVPIEELLDQVQNRRRPPPGIPTTATIGGEQISLRVQDGRRDRRTPDEIDDGKSGGFFQPLADAARTGDDVAARALYESLRLCERVPKTRAEFEAIKAGREKWFAKSGGPVTSADPARDFEHSIKNLELDFQRCEGVTDEMYVEVIEILRESAERSVSDDSRLAYAQAIASTDPTEARAQYELLWQHGWIEALGALARDSLPHELALVALNSAMASTFGAEQMRAVEVRVSPSTFAQASKEAAQILKNPKCCKF